MKKKKMSRLSLIAGIGVFIVIIIVITIGIISEQNSKPSKEKDTSVESSTTVETVSEPETSNEDTENLTVVNCTDLANILQLKDPSDPLVKEFANKYKGKIIEFDGNIATMNNHDSYKTRYDILIHAGEYSETSTVGPEFQFNDVGVYDLGLDGLDLPDFVKAGNNIHIIAEVEKYDEISGLFKLNPVLIESR